MPEVPSNLITTQTEPAEASLAFSTSDYDQAATELRSELQLANPLPAPLPNQDFYDSAAAELKMMEDQSLSLSIDEALNQNPEVAGEAQRIAAEKNLPPKFVLQNLNEMKRLSTLSRVKNYARYDPFLARQLRDPDFAALSYDDVDNLSMLDSIINNIKETGELISNEFQGIGIQEDLNRLSHKTIGRPITDKEKEQIKEYEREAATFLSPDATSWTVAAARMGSQIVHALPSGLMRGAQGALAGAAIGGIGGTFIGPVGTVGGALKGARVGGQFGFYAGMGEYSYIMESGNAYRTMLRDGIEPEIAAPIARSVGAAAAALDTLGTYLIFNPAAAAAKKVLFRKIVQLPQVRSALYNFAKQYGTTVAGETATEGLQEAIQILGNEIGRALSANDIESRLSTERGRAEVGNEILGAMTQAFKGTAIIGAPGPTISYAIDVKNERAARKNNEDLSKIAQAAKESKVRERNPEKFEKFIADNVEGTPAQNLYIEGSKLAQALNEKGLSRYQLSEQLPDAERQVDEALSTGGDVVIPTSEYTTYAANTELGEALSPHVRVDPEGMSISEADQFDAQREQLQRAVRTEQTVQQAETDLIESEARDIRNNIFNQLKKTKVYSDSVSRAFADFVKDFVLTQSARMDMTPAAFFDRYSYNIKSGRRPAMGVRRMLTRLVKSAGGEIPVFYRVGGNNAGGVRLTRDIDFARTNRNLKTQRQQGEPRGVTAIMNNPYQATLDEEAIINDLDQPEAAEALVANLKREGYDSVVLPSDKEVIVFNTNMVSRPETETDARTMFNQALRGGFLPDSLTTILNESADYSTFLHETSHFFLSAFSDMAAHPNASQQVRDDMQSILNWFGIKDVETWNAMPLSEQVQYHEQWAYNFELYISEGKAPSTKLQRLFDMFATWLRNIYRSIRDDLNRQYQIATGKDLPILTGEVRQVMDRMLASEEQIRQQDAIRNVAPLFETQEMSGMDDTEWTAYKETIQDAQDSSITDLENASIKQMRWLSNAKSRFIKDLQSKEKKKRAAIRKQVTEEVQSSSLYRAITFMKKGESVDAEGNVITEAEHKINTSSIDAMYADRMSEKPDVSVLRYGQYGLLTKEGGQPVQVLADMFDFESAESFLTELINAPPIKEAIDVRTDQRMLEENSDLNTPEAIQAAVEKALHNEGRSRFVAVELKFLSKATQPVRVMTAAANAVARTLLGNKVIKNIRVRDYTVAEGRASREAIALMKEGNPSGAIQAKRNQLVQNRLAYHANEAKTEISKALKDFRKFFRGNERLAKTRSVDLINAGRAILSYYQIGPPVENPMQYIEQIKEYNPNLYADIEPIVTDAIVNAKHYRELTLDQFRELRDSVDSLWFVARRENQIMVGEKLVNLDKVIGDLNDRIEKVASKKRPFRKTQMAPGTKERMFNMLNSFKAGARRVEHWTAAMDGPTKEGPFTRYIWQPIREAADLYRNEQRFYTKEYVDSINTLKGINVAKIDAPEINYLFGNGNGGIGKAELLGAMLHTGNESNLRKLLLGRDWGSLNPDGTLNTSRWDAFVERMIGEGVLTKGDYDWMQSVWDLNERIKPAAQKAYKEITGFYFKEVPASPIETIWGTYEGGYVPAKTDPNIVRDAQTQAKMEELASDFRNAMPTTGMGFTKARVEYNKPLSLDLRLITKHIDEVLRFAYLQPRIEDLTRIVRKRSFADNLSSIDKNAIEGMLLPWMNRTARQVITEPGRNRFMDRFWTMLRNNTGIAIMFANLSNATQQLTGWYPASLEVKPSYLRKALFEYIFDPTQTTQNIVDVSPFMEDRLKSQLFDIIQGLDDVILKPNVYTKSKNYLQRNAYFLQRFFQNNVDITTWLGAYNQAVADLPVEMGDVQVQREAVKRADAAVRMTQSSLKPEDLSAYEVGSPLYRILTQFANFFNMMLNLNMTKYTHIFRDLGWKQSKMRIAQTMWYGFVAPMLVAKAIVMAYAGDWNDEDEDGWMDTFSYWFFGGLAEGGIGMIPYGQNITGLLNEFTGRGYKGEISISPVISTGEKAILGTIRAVQTVIDPDKDLKGRTIYDFATLISLLSGFPTGPFAKRGAYVYDVESGRIRPTSEADYVRGVITGTSSQASRR